MMSFAAAQDLAAKYDKLRKMKVNGFTRGKPKMVQHILLCFVMLVGCVLGRECSTLTSFRGNKTLMILRVSLGFYS
jgi:hypothetical protein